MVGKKIKKRNQEKKSKTRETLALIFALTAIAFLLINSLYLLVFREKIISEISQNSAVQEFNIENLPGVANTILIALTILWFVLAIIFSFIVYYIETKKWRWYWLLVVSVITLAVGRLETAILGIIASILYIKR